MKVLVTGASGLIGSSLKEALTARGDTVQTLKLRGPEDLKPGVFDGVDAVISLGGASVGRLPWTKSYRKTLISSRLKTTRALAEALSKLPNPPHWLSASASGFYGDRPGETLTEDSGPGDTFLAKLCVEWEGEAQSAGSKVPITLLRTSPVIHPDGVLKPQMVLTRLGIAGPLGGGKQIWPWISLPDETSAIIHALDNKILGPINLVGPTRATANETGRALAKALRRPFFMPVPAWALRLVLGSAADSLLLSDCDMQPKKLLDSGFKFAHESVEEAINDALAAN